MKAKQYSVIPRTGFTEREIKRALKKRAIAKRRRIAKKRARGNFLSLFSDKRMHTDVICDIPELGFYFSANQHGLEFNSCKKAVSYVRRRVMRYCKNEGIDIGAGFEFDHDYERGSRIVTVIIKRQGLPERMPKLFGGQGITEEDKRNRRTA